MDRWQEREDWLEELFRRWKQEKDREAGDQLLGEVLEIVKERLRRGAGELQSPNYGVSDAAISAARRVLPDNDPDRFESLGRFQAFLARVVQNLLISARRREARHESDEPEALVGRGWSDSKSDSGLGEFLLSDEVEQLRKAIEELDPEPRRVIELVYFEGKSIRSLARELPWSTHQISRFRDQAISKLRKVLEEST